MASTQPQRTGVAKRFELVGQAVHISKAAATDPADHGYVTGYVVISKVAGEDYYDTQGEHVPEDVLDAAAIEFMKAGAAGKVMHGGEVVGTIVESIVLTTEKAAALGITTDRTGWIVSWAPASAEVRKRFTSGELKAFSIGGEGWVIDESKAVAA